MPRPSLYLADSNILLRLVKGNHPEFPLVRGAIRALTQKGMTPAYTLQNMTEFWNASTRPKERNGFGLTVEETERNAQDIERSFTFLADTEAVYREWRRIVVQYGVSGVQVHDARLAASMWTPNRPFRDVAHEYLLTQEARAKRGEISAARPKKLRAVIEGTLDRYAGSTQVHLIGDERWGGYPAWRRENGAGRHRRNGVREVTADAAQSFADHEAERRTKVQHSLGIRVLKPIEVKPSEERVVPFISDSTIRFEMSIFGAVMNYAVKKRYVPASQRFDERPKLKTMRRDEFTLEEYRKLHTVGRKWIGEADKPSSVWYRTVTYNLILIACNTGMRPAEMKNLRWRDIMPAKDREGREIVVLFVQGKGKSRKLVAPKSVGDYLERIRAISKATEQDDRVFTNIAGKPAKTLYSSLIADLLNEANLREGTQGVPRSTYCFRHTYATLRLQEGVDVYFLAEQMGTSVHMIESHYGHVNTIKHADRVLQGMAGWELPQPDDARAKASKAAEMHDKGKGGQRHRPR